MEGKNFRGTMTVLPSSSQTFILPARSNDTFLILGLRLMIPSFDFISIQMQCCNLFSFSKFIDLRSKLFFVFPENFNLSVRETISGLKILLPGMFLCLRSQKVHSV